MWEIANVDVDRWYLPWTWAIQATVQMVSSLLGHFLHFPQAVWKGGFVISVWGLRTWQSYIQLLSSVLSFEPAPSDPLPSQNYVLFPLPQALSSSEGRLTLQLVLHITVGDLYALIKKYTVQSPRQCHRYVSWFSIFSGAVQIRRIVKNNMCQIFP